MGWSEASWRACSAVASAPLISPAISCAHPSEAKGLGPRPQFSRDQLLRHESVRYPQSRGRAALARGRGYLGQQRPIPEIDSSRIAPVLPLRKLRLARVLSGKGGG